MFKILSGFCSYSYNYIILENQYLQIFGFLIHEIPEHLIQKYGDLSAILTIASYCSYMITCLWGDFC